MSEVKGDDPKIAQQVRAITQRIIQRNIKGLEFLTASPIPVGLSPKDVVLSRGTMRLYHYRSMADEVYRVPLLIVMATTNKAFLFDLAPGQSMVEFLLKSGFDVYVIDWEAPTAAERGLDLKTYTQDFIPSCVRTVLERSGEPDVSIVGYCMGGVLSLIYAATHSDGPLKNLACLTTPVNWHGMELNRIWSDERYFDIDQFVDAVGVVPADFIQQGFEMLRPAQKTAGRIRVWEQMWNDEFVKSYRAFERWGNETLPLAGEYFRETTKELLWRNKLYTGELMVDGKSANLANIKVPVLHAIAEHDHICPETASKPLLQLVGSTDKEEIKLKGGHVSLIAGPSAVKRMWPRLANWLAERSV